MFSFHKVSGQLVDIMLLENSSKSSYREIYSYGMEILLSSIANVFFILTLATMLGIQKEAFIYCMCFLPFRFIFGGAHAKTHVHCILTFAICMLSSVLAAQLLQGSQITFYLEITLFAVSVFANYDRSNEKKGILPVVCYIVLFLGIVAARCLKVGYVYSLCATLGTFTQAISLVIKERRM